MTGQPLLFADDPLEARFRQFHDAHPEIYRLFANFAAQALAAGRTHYSADALLHRIRWHVDIDVRDDSGFKINDHYSAFYARLWLAEHPQHAGFFETRRRAPEATS